jgi:A/G-specific adenine glycosylase
MLQQTRVEAVKPYFERFLQALPSITALADAPEGQILKLWEGLGYYNRVRNMQKSAQIVVGQYRGELPANQEALLALPGIGSYTAGAIASIAFHLPVPAVDGNVLRVATRILAHRADITKPQVKKEIEQAFAKIMPQTRAGDFNQSLMELGATVCLPNGVAKCEVCPLNRLCRAYQQNIVTQLPVKVEKRPRKIEDRTVFVILCGGKAALRKREEAGLLAGLWELPNIEGTLNATQAKLFLQSWGFEPQELEPLPKAKHFFSHIEWHMNGWAVNLEKLNRKNGFVWADRRAFAETYTLPTAFQAYTKEILRRIK